MSNLAWGNSICFSSPHYKSTVSGINEYIIEKNNSFSLCNGAMKVSMSLFFNLPHLCGLGGDAIIMERNNGEISAINGTGKTGTYQNAISYESKGLKRIPRRGIYSTMIYGAPYAFDMLARKRNVDLKRITETLITDDFNRGFIKIPQIKKLLNKAELELSETTEMNEWRMLLNGEKHINHSFIDMMRRVSTAGFLDLYKGKLGDEVYTQLAKYDNRLYSESDFLNFIPNYSEVRTMRFMECNVFCHGANSPWRELFLFLKIYELFAKKNQKIDYAKICNLAPYIEEKAIHIEPSIINYVDKIEEVAISLFDMIENSFLDEKDIINKQSHTIFLAGVNRDGDLIGISNSIFTPLGALFEVKNTGILLSNRCYAFNEIRKGDDFRSYSPVKHTNNCVIVESDDISFVIGTSGGPVQSQTLSFIINKIMAEEYQPYEAIKEPRFANMGYHPKTKEITYLTEMKGLGKPFICTNGLSDKLGVVQMAGINKVNGLLFSISDPRSYGVALGY
ncbi:gamma-glutamyltransferase [Photorhabdus sp. CRCIA-P01]|uniref:gamma-glutamyltransferase n=1 Tax=Photorhabdus sp. CRCIA-P01 TaxID=2019570 RepID=UPI000E5A07DD|nr:gamma-glutamyltransferase [Photorhabdus sp. CRCIA-P01]